MTETKKDATNFILPPSLISRIDLSRLVREVESVDGELESQKVRNHSSGHDDQKYVMPNISQTLDDFLSMNKLDITDNQARMVLKEQMQILKNKAPIIHMTFATEADPEALSELTDWVRKNLHPQALISVGLQPSLVGGVYLRTPNHVHDFSLRANLENKRNVIMDALGSLI
jgi:G3E family GTPase